ncbi:hypothetical protein DASC09_054410 [Saccharomycopsis crataegensis]|uniref:Uncharacterized protein n=1 Tax=Saccharomycopsis crataegensis TaxID=43959 RepID=A0AAV5QUA0_9ASCO|nr:hypothetical protein DASC09_054410 [Saccharomycopsis crataegensis]
MNLVGNYTSGDESSSSSVEEDTKELTQQNYQEVEPTRKKRPAEYQITNQSHTKRNIPLPPPPELVFDKYWKDPALASLKSFIEPNQEPKNMGVDNLLFRSSLSCYFSVAIPVSTSQLQGLNRITQEINKLLVKRNFRLDKERFYKNVYRMRTNEPQKGIPNHSWYYNIRKPANVKAYDPWLETDEGDANKFFKNEAEYEKLAQEYNDKLLEVNKTRFLELKEKVDETAPSDNNNTSILADYNFMLFRPNYINRFGVPVALHMSYSLATPLPEEKREAVNEAALELRKLVNMVNKYRKSDNYEVAKEVLPKKIGRLIDSELKVQFKPKLYLLPNSNFSRLFLAYKPTFKELENCVFFSDLIRAVPFFKEAVSITEPSSLHVSICEFELPFPSRTHHKYNMLIADQINDAVNEYNGLIRKRDAPSYHMKTVFSKLNLRIHNDQVSFKISGKKSEAMTGDSKTESGKARNVKKEATHINSEDKVSSDPGKVKKQPIDVSNQKKVSLDPAKTTEKPTDVKNQDKTSSEPEK